MKRIVVFGFLTMFVISGGCRSKKEEIVKAMKVAKKHIENGHARIDAIEDIQKIESEMFKNRVPFKTSNPDSNSKYYKMGLEEQNHWQPIYDSLEMELKKY